MSEENVEKTTEKQLGGITGKGFMPGVSGNPNGRPKGSISIITRLKQIFEEDPVEFDNFIEEYRKDPQNRKHIVEMIDGKARQPIDQNVTGDITINIVRYNDNSSS